ncbi:MAG TPA: hypothetical protein VHR86_05820, partial [Armatimonadota bacterium]|nr:hypothetical protein [Armatimonadota bacterium]
MTRVLLFISFCLLLLAGAIAVPAQTVILNGEKVSVTYIDKDGKPYADIIALVQMLGGKVTYDKAAKKLYITLPKGGDVTSAAAGTDQLAGAWAKLNTVYTIGKANPFYITLKSVEYSVSRVIMGDSLTFPKKEEKLLILHVAIQNPRKEDAGLNWNCIHYTAYDDKNNGYPFSQDFGEETG